MPLRCPGCHHTLDEDELPRLDEGARVLCPQCNEPLTLPEMTIPLSLAAVKPQPTAGTSGPDPDKRFALLVVSGAAAGKVFELEAKAVTIGRSGCDVVLDDPELSRRHARIEIDGSLGTLEDLGSTNGTFVGKERIERASLENRSKFRVGSHELAFVVTEK